MCNKILQSQDSQQKGNTFPQSLPVTRLRPRLCTWQRAHRSASGGTLSWLFAASTACQHWQGSLCPWEIHPFCPNSWGCFSQGRREHHESFLLAAQPTAGIRTHCGCPKEAVKEGRAQRRWCISQRSEQTPSRNLAPKQGRKTLAVPGFR